MTTRITITFDNLESRDDFEAGYEDLIVKVRKIFLRPPDGEQGLAEG